MEARVDFSAQFGGRDAAADVLPHFRALKRAAHDLTIASFPFSLLAFVLRVDGSVNTYGPSGLSNPELAPDGSHLSLDIGVSVDDRAQLSTGNPKPIGDALRNTSGFLRRLGDPRLNELDFDALDATLATLEEAYRSFLTQLTG